MEINKTDHTQSTNIMEEYGENEPPVDRSPRMLQLTIPQGSRTDFNAKDNRTRKKTYDKLQRALAAVVGEQGLAGAPIGIGSCTIRVAVKETFAKPWECIRKGKIEIKE